MEALAARLGVRYVRRSVHVGAKAGNINHALRHVHAPYVAVFDCDHVPAPAFLERCLGHFDAERVALVQPPQWYANARSHEELRSESGRDRLFSYVLIAVDAVS